ncbi:fumarylacetoacetate hydrolase family protein [Rhizobium leguminosarum bv. viciae]|uniref:Fumarylacetoacetate hydrolase family protein n=2 Tax=Rhizobium leguminosarum TaxID=384 RepID=A0A8I2GV52_RHILV|nr:fumarylacetoacetate hydrolase family protein [Rhizobium leguminosarum bv. viciae]
MKLGLNGGRAVGFDEHVCIWRLIDHPHSDDLLALLSLEPDALAKCLGERSDAPRGLPFKPGSLRSFALWERHMTTAAKGMVSRFGSPLLKSVAAGYERLTGKPIAPMRPRPNYYRFPQYYMGNHRSLMEDGEELPWPSFSDVVDFELEIGLVIAKQVRDCTPSEGLSAIGGFCIVNDWSARDVQWDDTRRGTFGGVVKAKTFAGAIGAIVVTADEILPRFNQLTGKVRVNGDIWCEGNTENAQHGLGEVVSYAAMGETVYPGDLLSTGTLAGCCGLEMGRFPSRGDEVQLEIKGIGTLTNRIGN